MRKICDFMDVRKKLQSLSDKKYAAFQAKLIPNISEESVLGVRVPVLRKYAKEFGKMPESEVFLNNLPHASYDENVLHALLLEQIKDFDTCICRVKEFLPYVDNWAVCDLMRPKALLKNKEILHEESLLWLMADEEYICRYGMEVLMNYFLEADSFPSDISQVASICREEYYVNMMMAWYFATALAIRFEETIVYLQENRLPVWVHNKSIQKAVESYRITAEQKKYLKLLKR